MSQLKHLSEPPRHHFIVFSVVDDSDVVIPKFAQCNNCGLIHKVTDICKSEIVRGRESMTSIASVDDIRLGMPKALGDLLEGNNADLPTWEAAQFILENKFWGDFVVLTTDHSGGARQGKYVRILSESMFKVDTFFREETLQVK
ncbi:MAG: hypothetical protein WC761_07030 [Candidatus Paceibacterota bacterium]